jgi:Spo0E like sporulation regulatory protein
MKNSYEILFIQIERKREEMILLGNQYGLMSTEVIQVSQELDRLLNNLVYLKKYSCPFK